MSFYDKVRRQKFLSFTLILFTLSVGIVIGTLVQTGAKAAKEQTAAPDATPLTVPNPVQTENEFTKVAKMLEPSVVNISTEYIPKTNVQTKATPQRRGNSNRRMTKMTTTAERMAVATCRISSIVSLAVREANSRSRRTSEVPVSAPASSLTGTATS